ncbi:MAG: hypothetical protein QOG90_1293, partial [Actinomycetota bacterium]
MGKRYAVLAAVVVVLVGGRVMLSASDDGPSTKPPPIARVGPLTANIHDAYALSTPLARHPVVVGAGTVGAKRWIVVGYLSPAGRLCWQMRGYFGDQTGVGCRKRDVMAPYEEMTGSGPSPGRFVEVVAVTDQVQSFRYLTDSGRSWSPKLVRLHATSLRMFATVYPTFAELGRSASARIWVDRHGEEHSDIANALPAGLTRACASANPPLHGAADGLPHAGATTFATVQRVADRSGAEIMSKYDASAVSVEPRGGDVWTRRAGEVVVVPAADAFLRVYLHSSRSCPGA